jgi:crotonobetainyl-CoA:carnitine CoA-transferase CaiB-like acyl-CoA transferase
MGRPALADDDRFATATARKRNEDAVEAVVEEWTRTLSPEEATEKLQGAGVAAFTSMSNKDLAEDPHLAARGFFVDLEHPEVGKRHHAGLPWRFSDTACAVRAPAPTLGQHTREVLEGLLGYSSAEVDGLEKAGVLT